MSYPQQIQAREQGRESYTLVTFQNKSFDHCNLWIEVLFVLVFYCPVTWWSQIEVQSNTRELALHLFYRSEVWNGMAGLSAQGLTRLKLRSQWAEFSSGGSGEKSIFKLTQIVGRIQFLMVLWLRSEFSWWLLPGGPLQLLDLFLRPYLWGNLSSRQWWHVKSFSCFESLTSFFVTNWRKRSTFKGVLWLG